MPIITRLGPHGEIEVIDPGTVEEQAEADEGILKVAGALGRYLARKDWERAQAATAGASAAVPPGPIEEPVRLRKQRAKTEPMKPPNPSSLMPAAKKLERIDALTPMLLADIHSALATRAVMGAGNEVMKQRPGAAISGGSTANIIQQGLARTLMMSLARIFDVDRKRPFAKQDTASVPLLADHLRDDEVRELLRARARRTNLLEADQTAAEVDVAIGELIARYDRVSEAETLILDGLKGVRDYRLAHTLFHKSPAGMFAYADLFLLTDIARDFGALVIRAITASVSDLPAYEGDLAVAAFAFWQRAMPEIGPAPVKA